MHTARPIAAFAGTLLLAVACSSEAPLPTAGTVHLDVIAGGHHGGAPSTVAMTQEVTSAPAWAGDPDGRGDARLTINVGQGEVCWEIAVRDIALPATAAHIHEAPVGVRGPVVVGLSAPGADGATSGCASGVNRELLRRLLTDPSAFYVNVHTTDFPAGAVRGQMGE